MAYNDYHNSNHYYNYNLPKTPDMTPELYDMFKRFQEDSKNSPEVLAKDEVETEKPLETSNLVSDTLAEMFNDD